MSGLAQALGIHLSDYVIHCNQYIEIIQAKAALDTRIQKRAVVAFQEISAHFFYAVEPFKFSQAVTKGLNEDILQDFQKIAALFEEHVKKSHLTPFDLLPSYRSRALKEAAYHGHTLVVFCLLQMGSISKKERGSALKTAAENGYDHIVRALLENGPISEIDQICAVQKSIEKGYLPIVQAFLENRSMSKEDKDWAVIVAAKHGQLTMVQAFLENGSMSCPLDRESAIEVAIDKGHQEIAELLQTVKIL